MPSVKRTQWGKKYPNLPKLDLIQIQKESWKEFLEKEFIETFTKEMGTIDCSDLKAKYRNDEIKCNLVIFKAGEILDRIVEREGLN